MSVKVLVCSLLKHVDAMYLDRLKKKNKEVKRRGGGFTKLCSLSPQLQKFTGVPELARTEV